jgi:hypothetical protein
MLKLFIFFELTFFCFYRSLCSAMVIQHVFDDLGVFFNVFLGMFVQLVVQIQAWAIKVFFFSLHLLQTFFFFF